MEDINKILEVLHPVEKKILKYLKDKDWVEPSVIAKDLNLSIDAVYRGVRWLASKGLVIIDRTIRKIIKLNEKGEKVLKYGIPEKKLLKVALEGEYTINELRERTELSKKEFNAALGICKKKKLIEIKEGKVYVTDLGKRFLEEKQPIERFFEELKSGKIYEDEIENKEGYEEAKERGLFTLEPKPFERVKITEAGREIARKIKEVVEEIGHLTPEILSKKLWKGKKFRKYDLKAPVPRLYPGKRHPYERFLKEIKEKLVELGFKEMENVHGPIVELMFWNCDALFMPQDHPAREIHDIYYIKEPKYGEVNEELLKKVKERHLKGWGIFNEKFSKRLILRSHCTAISARELASNIEIPGRYFAIARVFRPDTIDWKHFIEFCQLEGIIVDYSLTFKDLLGVLKELISEIIGISEVKFRPGYFPFTEPSVEAFVKIDNKWVEVGGAGIFRPEVVEPLLGKFVPVIAWGLGIDRLYMARYGIKDIRELYTKDLEFLKNARII